MREGEREREREDKIEREREGERETERQRQRVPRRSCSSLVSGLCHQLQFFAIKDFGGGLHGVRRVCPVKATEPQGQ